MAKRADLVYRRTQIGTDWPGEVIEALGLVTTLAAPPPADLQGGSPS
jgi:hypothetical protein